MSKDGPSREKIAANRLTLQALEAMPDYSPFDPALTVPALQQLDQGLRQAELEEQKAEVDLKDKRTRRIALANAHQDAFVASRSHVRVQYGPDSIQVHAVGLTRKSDRKRRARRVPLEG